MILSDTSENDVILSDTFCQEWLILESAIGRCFPEFYSKPVGTYEVILQTFFFFFLHFQEYNLESKPQYSNRAINPQINC